MSVLLPTRRIEKPWGAQALPAAFPPPAPGERIGEIWFEPPPELDGLLVKYLFTEEKLSIQVHPPGDAGKEECWLVIAAEPGATIGIGFTREVSAEEMRQAALDGSIEDLLAWREVRAGDYIYIPAGTVHAIGAGLCLAEVQQNNDVTYRLYDYGRPRELHLDEAVAVAHGGPHDPALRRALPQRGQVALAEGPRFRIDRLEGPPDAGLVARYSGPLLVVPLDHAVTVAGEAVAPGQCALALTLVAVEIAPDTRCLIAQPCARAGG